MSAAPVNSLADFVNNLVGLFISGDEAAIEAFITLNAPVLEGPIIGFFTNEIVNLLGNAVKKNMAELADSLVFAVQTDSESSAVKDAFNNLQSAKANGDASAVTDAQNKFIAAAAALARDDGASDNT